MLRKITIFVLSISILAMLGACAKDAPKTESAPVEAEKKTEAPPQVENKPDTKGLPSQFKTEIPESSQSTTPTTSAYVPVDEKQLMVGTWRHGWLGQPNCGSEHVFSPNGSYSGMGGCAGFVPLRQIGKWYISSPGVVKVVTTDFEPKRDQAGNPIRFSVPFESSWNFRFIDRNRQALGDGAIIAYRVN